MVRTVALQHSGAKLAAFLRMRGYRVIDLGAAARFHAHVDAILYNGHRPEVRPAAFGPDEIGRDDRLAAAAPLADACRLNISGLAPERVVALLEQSCSRRHWRP